MVELHETDVDGVRCFWVETGRPTLATQLLFRTGMADESLPESGWLHALEHLALHGRGGGALHVNGSVSLLHTTFDTHGPHDAVVEHLAGVTAWLRTPVFDEFERERGVLRAESALRGGTASRAFGWRYGAQGPGVITYAETGLGRATPDRLTARAQRVFTRQNACLVLDGPPPAGLRLDLGDGELLATQPAVPVEDTLPAAYVEEGGLVLSGVVERSLAATIAQEILQRALRDRLRDTAGAAYAPWASYERVDARHALLLGGSDVQPSVLPELVDSVLHLVRAMRTEPVPATWLAEAVANREQAMNDPYATVALAARAAHLHLDGELPVTHDELVKELHELDADAVAAELRRFGDSVLLGVPAKAAWRDQLPMLRQPDVRVRAQGTSYRSIDWPASGERLHVSPERLEISSGDVARAVDLTDVAGLQVFADGTRWVIGRDGWGLGLHPDAWHDGTKARAALDAAVPSELHLPQPAREGIEVHRLPAARRWRLGLRRLFDTTAAAWVGLVLAALLVVVGIATLHLIPIVSGGLGAAALATKIRTRRAERDKLLHQLTD